MNAQLQVYKKMRVSSASPRETLVALHDKMISELNLASQDWHEQRIPEMRDHIVKIQDIASYLRASIDERHVLAGTLAPLYAYYLVQLAQLFMNPSEEIFTELRDHFIDWRDTWSKT